MSITELEQLKKYVKQLEKENTYLREKLKQISLGNTSVEITASEQDVSSEEPHIVVNLQRSPDEKIQLFRSLFRGREDVYAVRWENAAGKSGYTPACGNEWVKPICQKPKIKCSQCPNKKLIPFADTVIYNHLSGKSFVGIYPLLQDDTCYFLAVDFDKDTWQRDVLAFYETCKKYAIPALLERSQSGNGAHVWIFFTNAISAQIARNLGTGLLTATMQENPQLSMDSYDRLFPNQDTLPQGGYGNLIALPLQGLRRKQGNSTFIDENFNPYDDPWCVLEKIKTLSITEMMAVIQKLSKTGSLLDIEINDDATDEKPWEMLVPPIEYPVIDENSLPKTIDIVFSNLIYVETKHLPKPIITKLKKLAAFQNPEFYRAQALRLSTHDKPRIISCADFFKEYIGLPRGCIDKVNALFAHYHTQIKIQDKTNLGQELLPNFQFTLREDQQSAFDELIKHRYGVLAATTAFGKTVLAGKIIAERKINTLILVHRQQLLEQWQEKLSIMLDIPKKQIGVLVGGKNKLTGLLDIAMLQSLSTREDITAIMAGYGQIIVDECHHISAFSFEQILKKACPHYVLGLTATPKRKDGHHPIITMQCGPIRYYVSNKSQLELSGYQHRVFVKHTPVTFALEHQNASFSDLYDWLIHHEERNQNIIHDVLSALDNGRTPILLTERTDHLAYFEKAFHGLIDHVFILKGGLSASQRKQSLEKLFNLPPQEKRLILATGRYIGEGFDDPRLDTLFLTLPISWQGTLQQYVGRLQRFHQDKHEIHVYDYADTSIPMLNRMLQKRLKKYHAMGYTINET